MDTLNQQQLDELKIEIDKLIVSKTTEFKQKMEDALNAEQQKRGKSLNDYLGFTNFYTTNASMVNRSLALAGFAIIWIFKKSDTTHEVVKGLLNTPLILLTASMALDLLQYFFGAIAWKWFYERKYWLWIHEHEAKNSYAHDITAPNGISTPIYILWFVKIVLMIAAYWEIFCFLRKQF